MITMTKLRRLAAAAMTALALMAGPAVPALTTIALAPAAVVAASTFPAAAQSITGGAPASKLLKPGNVGIKVFTATTGDTTAYPSGSTFEVLMGLAQDFDAVKLITMAGYSSSSMCSPAMIASVTTVGDTTDATLNAASWSQVFWGGNGNTSNTAATATNQHKYQVSDWVTLPSAARADGGMLPLLVARAYLGNCSGTQNLMGNPAKSYTNWATHPSGRLWRMRVNATNAVQNYATANQAQFTGYRTGGGATITTAGSGFATGDTVTFGGASPYTAAVYTVTASGGAVTALTLQTAGVYPSNPATLTQTATSGSGSGLVITPAWTSISTTVQQSPIVGACYAARGKVVAVAAAADSITEGQGTFLGEGFVVPSAVAVSNKAAIAVETANIGWAGSPSTIFGTVANDFLNTVSTACGPPDILIVPNYSPNDVTSGSLTASSVAMGRARVSTVVATGRALGIVPIFWTGLATDFSIRAYGTSDSLRVALNADTLSWRYRGVRVVDAAGALLGGTDANGQQFMAAANTNDKIHPNDAGNAVLAPLFANEIRAVIGSGQ